MPFLKTPRFWYKKSTTLPCRILTPFSWVYGLGRKLDTLKHSYKPPINVICIGNLTAGGGGKTPAALMVMDVIQAENIFNKPAFLTKGYGRLKKGTFKADPSHSWKDIGDEACLLNEKAPVYICDNRKSGIELALKDGVDCLISDDGFQDSSIRYNLAGLVINSYDGFGNERLLPAGPLRESLSKGLDRTDFILLIQDDRGTRFDPDTYSINCPVIKCSLKKAVQAIDSNKKYIAFCGIARPEKFYASLKEEGPEKEGLEVTETYNFPDHRPYTEGDLEPLLKQAKKTGAKIITTEKDFVRLPDLYKNEVITLPIRLDIDTPQTLLSLIKKTKPDNKFKK